MKKEKNELVIPCDCGGHHFLVFNHWDDDTELWTCMINADNHAPLLGRIQEAIRYIFGRTLTFHDVVLNKEDMEKVRIWFSEQ